MKFKSLLFHWNTCHKHGGRSICCSRKWNKLKSRIHQIRKNGLVFAIKRPDLFLSSIYDKTKHCERFSCTFEVKRQPEVCSTVSQLFTEINIINNDQWLKHFPKSFFTNSIQKLFTRQIKLWQSATNKWDVHFNVVWCQENMLLIWSKSLIW